MEDNPSRATFEKIDALPNRIAIHVPELPGWLGFAYPILTAKVEGIERIESAWHCFVFDPDRTLRRSAVIVNGMMQTEVWSSDDYETNVETMMVQVQLESLLWPNAARTRLLSMRNSNRAEYVPSF